MTFRRLSEYFSELEATTLRNKMTEILSRLFQEASTSEIGNLCYLLQGRVAPLFTAVEFGLGDKMMMRAVAQVLDTKLNTVEQIFKKEGDLGKTVEKLKKNNKEQLTKNKNLTITDVYNILYQVATSGGLGSQEIKLRLLGDLLREVDPLSSRYIVKITLAKLRLGFSDMTILDSLSWMITGDKSHRAQIEKAYNVRPDLGYISETLKKDGIEGLEHVKPKVGIPILMARAERMTNGKDIIEKIGECATEPKYDGLRLQVHYIKEQRTKNKEQKGGKDTTDGGRRLRHLEGGQFIPSAVEGDSFQVEGLVKLFSRNLEDVTIMYPDIVDGVKKEVKAKEAIFEGEAIGIDLKSGRYLPFQETVQRKRKYDIEAMAKKIPLKLIAFDLLYLDGENLINKPYRERRRKLEKILLNQPS